jgi:hypothetical protein
MAARGVVESIRLGLRESAGPPYLDRAATLLAGWSFGNAACAATPSEEAMNNQQNPNEKPGQSQDQLEQQRQREQQQRQDQQQDQGGKKQGFDKDQIPQGGPSDNGPMTAPDADE